MFKQLQKPPNMIDWKLRSNLFEKQKNSENLFDSVTSKLFKNEYIKTLRWRKKQKKIVSSFDYCDLRQVMDASPDSPTSLDQLVANMVS